MQPIARPVARKMGLRLTSDDLGLLDAGPGLHVPYWLFSCSVDMNICARAHKSTHVSAIGKLCFAQGNVTSLRYS